MITREEYNNALDVVESYHKQLFIGGSGDKLRDSGKTLWQQWDKLPYCSTRLTNTILSAPDLWLEDMNFELFNRLRNAGKRSWIEFEKLRGY